MSRTATNLRETVIDIARDFSPYPAGRYRKDGPYSGQHFREEVLLPRLVDDVHVRLIIDGVAGLPSSFWEEVFGGLVRQHKILPQYLREHISVETSQTSLRPFVRLAFQYADEAARV
jgi:hypothetical protein